MKRRILFSFLLTSCLVSLFISSSCKKIENGQNVDLTDYSNNPKNSVVKINCLRNGEGNTIGGLEGMLSQGSKGYLQCKSDDCNMVITTITNGDTTKHELVNAQMNVAFLEDFNSFINREHPGITASIMEIEQNKFEEDFSVLYVFTLNDGTTTSVMFAKVGETRYEINCTGACDGRQSYDFSNPPKAECSSSDCVMKVTQLPN